MGIHLGDFNLAHVVVNCLSYGNSMNPNLGSGATATTNSWQNGHTVTDADFTNVDQALLTTARQSDGSLPVVDFLRLDGTSDLIDAGTEVEGISYFGSAPDIGAYEYVPEPITIKNVVVNKKSIVYHKKVLRF